MSTVDDVRAHLDILDVVAGYVPLQRSGRSYKSLCPFHSEKTASMYVFPERQTWRCFGACATGGDVFSFVMRSENIDFGEALRSLARRVGVELPTKGARKQDHDSIHQANEAAAQFFRKRLAAGGPGARARKYLQTRGLTDSAIEKFELGLAPPDGRSLREHLLSDGYSEAQLALAGLVTQFQGSGYRDLFRGRLVFPIRDGGGSLAGFAGRSLDDSGPKYLNSPKTPVFDKGTLFYGLHLAMEASRDKGMVIVEGYMDAIIAHQQGFANVVASMGTALTRDQVALVRRVLQSTGVSDSAGVVLALDSDAAGREATLRSLESAWNVFHSPNRRQAATSITGGPVQRPLTISIAELPPGKDPDEVILENPDEWARLVTQARPLMDYLFAILSTRFDLSSPEGKASVAELLYPLVAATRDPFQQDSYFQRLAALLGVSEETLTASMGRVYRSRQTRPTALRNASGEGAKARVGRKAGPETAASAFSTMERDPLEEYCLALLLQHPNAFADHTKIRPANGAPSARLQTEPSPPESGTNRLRLEYFRRVENREVFTNWAKCPKLEVLKDTLDEEIRPTLDHLLSKSIPPSDQQQLRAAFDACVRRLEERHLRELKREEGLRLAQASAEEIQDSGPGILQLNERLKLLFKQ